MFIFDVIGGGESRHVSDHIQHGIAKVNSNNCARKQDESNGKSTTAGVQPFTLLCTMYIMYTVYIYIYFAAAAAQLWD